MLNSIELFVMICIAWMIKLYIFQQISLYRLGWKKMLLISSFLGIIAEIDNDILLYCEPLYFPIIFLFLKKNWNWRQYFFYSFFPFVLDDLLIRLIGLYVRFTLHWSVDEMWNTWWSSLLFVLLEIPIYIGFLKLFRLDFQGINKFMKQSKLYHLLVPVNFSLFIYLILMSILRIIELQDGYYYKKLYLSFDARYYMNHILIIYLFVFLAFLFYMNYTVKEEKEREILQVKEEQLTSISDYSRYIENLYKEIRGFRHDYTNILVSLNGAIQENDISMVKNIYKSVLKDSDKGFYDNKYNIAHLSNIDNEAIKSLISAKLISAQSKGIAISVEVPEIITAPNLELLDMIKILSIFLDNAIEATILSESPSVTLAFFQEFDRKILIIENTIQKEKINTKEIFDYGFSSKGDNRGIGLANIKEILDKYPKLNLYTTSEHYIFSQEIHFFI